MNKFNRYYNINSKYLDFLADFYRDKIENHM